MTAFLRKVIVAILRTIWLFLRGLGWLVNEAMGENRTRRREERRRQMRERPPLSHEAFVEQLGLSPYRAATWIAVREAIAESCYLPAVALRPDDTLETLEFLMVSPPGAPWWDLGGDLISLAVGLEERLYVQISDEVFDQFWQWSRRGEVKTLRAVASWFGEVLPDRCVPLSPEQIRDGNTRAG
jgi:hypothetical protein